MGSKAIKQMGRSRLLPSPGRFGREADRPPAPKAFMSLKKGSLRAPKAFMSLKKGGLRAPKALMSLKKGDLRAPKAFMSLRKGVLRAPKAFMSLKKGVLRAPKAFMSLKTAPIMILLRFGRWFLWVPKLRRGVAGFSVFTVPAGQPSPGSVQFERQGSWWNFASCCLSVWSRAPRQSARWSPRWYGAKGPSPCPMRHRD